ncbi:MAG TPA: hypothetical protein VE685_07895 [Thermoanaerobaculia bacterium]|nr:hypothetical protein [Thermoanaerobaculia bacterium]
MSMGQAWGRRLGAFGVAAILAFHGGAASGQPPAGVEELTRNAPFVFRGTVQEAGASNVTGVPASARTVVVRVDEVLKAPAELGDFTGREITVQLQEPGTDPPGRVGVFFTRGWIYGETLGVVEVGRAAGDPGALRGQVLAADRRSQDQILAERVQGAALVVVGKVVETRPAETGPQPITEHDPQWWEAVIEVDSVLKGSKPEGNRVTVLYPESLDVMWYEAPKPRKGWDAVWLLYRGQRPGVSGEPYTVLKPWNILSRDTAETVRRLAGGKP